MDGPHHHPSRGLDILPLLVPRACGPVSARIQIAIERSIALGLFPEGRLPAERQLAATLAVSRTALRSALGMVRASGYAERSLVGRSGGVPTATGRALSADEIAAEARAARAEIGELLAVRMFLEPACARVAAAEPNHDRVQRMIDSQQRLASTPSQMAHRLTDGEFHYELTLASGTEPVVGAVLRARADLLRWRDRLPMEDTIGHSVTEHQAVIAAIEDGDPDGAEAATRAHLESSGLLFDLFLQRYIDEPISVMAEGRAAIDRGDDPERLHLPLTGRPGTARLRSSPR